MDNIEKTLTRGVEQILPSKKALEKLMKKKKITLYQGFDPSSKSLHLGNLIGIRKLAQFQKLGHKVIFLIGDFTGMIGDPTDKSSARKKLSKKEVLDNAKDYKRQIKNILKFDGPNKAEVKYNSEWLSKLTLSEIADLASNFTVQQMLERDFFQERLRKNKPVYIHEFIYPLMQGYDCIAMDVDLEIGGNDQLFNILAGRELMHKLKNKEKYVLTYKILEDATGNKMGKSEGNAINLTESPNDIYGKIMSFPDNFISLGIELLTDLPLDLVEKSSQLEAKQALSLDVVKQVYDEDSANNAQKYFNTTFRKKEPEYEKEVSLKETLQEVVFFATKTSISEAKRLIDQGAVDVNNENIKNPKFKLKGGEKIKIGKKTFIKVKK